MASFVAGGMAGAISRTIVSPLERMKILFQVQGPGHANYSGIVPTLSKMWREEGFKGYLRGNGTNCIRIIPYSATQFAAYSIYKKLLIGQTKSDLDTFRRLCAGAMAGITSVTLTYPLDLVRTRLSIQTSAVVTRSSSTSSASAPPRQQQSIWACIRQICKAEGGIFALYRGIFPTVLGVAPYVGINFAVYERMRELVTPKGKREPSAYGKLMSGAVSGGVAQTITYPMDVLRRRFQVGSMTGIGTERYKGVWEAVRSISRTEGYKGFYKGLLPNLLKVNYEICASQL